jgi:hypothetical protein
MKLISKLINAMTGEGFKKTISLKEFILKNKLRPELLSFVKGR